MDIDNVMDKIGGFGPAQMKIVALVNLAHIVSGFHALIYSFIATDPGWICTEKNQTSLDDCALVEKGTCTQEFYSNNFTSIVSEVRGGVSLMIVTWSTRVRLTAC